MELFGILITISWIVSLITNTINILVIVCFIEMILSIINLIFNKQLSSEKRKKTPIILFLILIIIELFIIITPIIMFKINMNNLKAALYKLQEEKNIETLVYKRDNTYIFIDNEANEIARKDYDKVLTQAFPGRFLFNIEINGNVANLGVAEKGNKTIIINSQGEEMFELCNLFDDSSDIVTNFFNYILANNIYGIQTSNKTSSNGNYVRNKNVLQKYNEINTSFEEDENFDYIYFKNKNITDKVLQIVVKKGQKEEDTKLIDAYAELEFNEEVNRDIDKILDFYKYEKDYYLLDINNESKTQLECNNLIYEAYYDENNNLCENILLYSNGSLPFFDTDETGYFNENGDKTKINTQYLIEDIDDNYMVVINKETSSTSFISVQTGELEKTIDDVVLVYNSFYIKLSSENDDEYEVLDKNLNEIATSLYEPELKGNNFMVILSKESSDIYFYDNKEINFLDNIDEYNIVSINSPSNDIKEYGESIYYMVGIITFN